MIDDDTFILDGLDQLFLVMSTRTFYKRYETWYFSNNRLEKYK